MIDPFEQAVRSAARDLAADMSATSVPPASGALNRGRRRRLTRQVGAVAGAAVLAFGLVVGGGVGVRSNTTETDMVAVDNNAVRAPSTEVAKDEPPATDSPGAPLPVTTPEPTPSDPVDAETGSEGAEADVDDVPGPETEAASDAAEGSSGSEVDGSARGGRLPRPDPQAADTATEADADNASSQVDSAEPAATGGSTGATSDGSGTSNSTADGPGSSPAGDAAGNAGDEPTSTPDRDNGASAESSTTGTSSGQLASTATPVASTATSIAGLTAGEPTSTTAPTVTSLPAVASVPTATPMVSATATPVTVTPTSSSTTSSAPTTGSITAPTSTRTPEPGSGPAVRTSTPTPLPTPTSTPTPSVEVVAVPSASTIATPAPGSVIDPDAPPVSSGPTIIFDGEVEYDVYFPCDRDGDGEIDAACVALQEHPCDQADVAGLYQAVDDDDDGLIDRCLPIGGEVCVVQLTDDNLTPTPTPTPRITRATVVAGGPVPTVDTPTSLVDGDVVVCVAEDRLFGSDLNGVDPDQSDRSEKSDDSGTIGEG